MYCIHKSMLFSLSITETLNHYILTRHFCAIEHQSNRSLRIQHSIQLHKEAANMFTKKCNILFVVVVGHISKALSPPSTIKYNFFQL